MSDFVLILLSLYCWLFDDSTLVFGPATEKDNKTKVISADLLNLDFDFEDIIIMFGNISVLVKFQFWWNSSFGDHKF